MGDTADSTWGPRDLDIFMHHREERWIGALMAHGATRENAESALRLCKRGARERGENPDVVCERFVADFLEARP